MSELTLQSLSSEKSWVCFCMGFTAGALSAAAGTYLWIGYKLHKDSQVHVSSQHLSTFSVPTSQPSTPATNRRGGEDSAWSAPHSSLLGTPRHGTASPAVREPDRSLEQEMAVGDNRDLLHLLYNMAEDQAKKESYVHRGISCNACNASPLCGNRYKCACCIDYDICERCEPHDRHNRTHVFIKIKIPIPPLANPRNILLKPFYPGKDVIRRRPPLAELQSLTRVTYFDIHEVEALHDQYRTLCTKDRGITRDVYDQCLGPLGLEKNLVMDRLFKFYDANGDGYIDFKEFVRGLSVLIKGSQEEKVKHAFEGYDLDKTGVVSRENLRKMFKAYFYITIELVRDVVKACEEEMMENFDDTQGRPVSSLFSAPIPSDTGANPSQTGKTPFPCNPGSTEDMWPVMEAMSQDAIEEMVENVFKMANADMVQGFTLEQFQELTSTDSSLLAWFDSLGTLF